MIHGVTERTRRDITYSNYIGLTAGIAAAAAGALLFGLTLLQEKLRILTVLWKMRALIAV